MKLETVTIPEQTIYVGPYKKAKTLPACEHTYAPTLAAVHDWLFNRPFHLSWHDGWLCPFDSGVDTKNMRCVAGRRKHCSGNGFLVDTTHLAPNQQHRHSGRVVCYEWCNRLADTYWTLNTRELLALPDDPPLVAYKILRQVYRESGWQAWRYELARRADRTYRHWLKPLPTRLDKRASL